MKNEIKRIEKIRSKMKTHAVVEAKDFRAIFTILKKHEKELLKKKK